MVADILRDSFFGWCCRFITGGRIFKYDDEAHPAIWQRYLPDDYDAVIEPKIPQPPPKSPMRTSPPAGEFAIRRDSPFPFEDLRQLQYPPMPPEPPEQIHVRYPARPSEDSVARTEWLNSKPSSATLVQERSARPSVSVEAAGRDNGYNGHSIYRSGKDVSYPTKTVKVSTSRSNATLAPLSADEHAGTPHIGRNSNSKQTGRATVTGNRPASYWRDTELEGVSDSDIPRNSKSADTKRFFVGFEFLKFVSCMVFIGSENIVSVSSSRHAPRPVKRPQFTGDGRPKSKRPRGSEDIPLRETRRSDIERGFDVPDEVLLSNDDIDSGHWEVQRRASLYIVGWHGPDDQDNPQNWSTPKKILVTLEICLLTLAVYIAAGIYSSAVVDISRVFGASNVVAIAGLSLFVVGYAFGPMLWSPLSEVPAIGRTSIYIVTLAVFVALQVPTFLATNIRTLLVLRFLAGFIGSPSLATGGASIAEMFNPAEAAYGMAFWGLFCACGPVLGSVAGGFAVEARGWTWSILPVLWISAFTLAIIFFLLPETSAANILHRRASRLRKLTGNPKVVCEADVASHGREVNVKHLLMNTLVRPFTVTFTEPIVLALNMYSAFIYGLLYLWFESFPVVFIEIYGFSLGTSGLMFLGMLIGAILTLPVYFWWLRTSVEPKVAKHRDFVPEWILPPCYVGAPALVTALFMFAWTSRENIHWIVPLVGTALFSVAIVLLFNALLNYLVLAYPTQAATVLAGNDLSRSLVGASFPLFGSSIYQRLGIAWGTSVLGFIAIAFIPVPLILVRYGPWLRKKSKMARQN